MKKYITGIEPINVLTGKEIKFINIQMMSSEWKKEFEKSNHKKSNELRIIEY